MQEICFITTNAGKVASLSRQLDLIRYRLIQEAVDIPEIQADTALEIAKYKADFAYQKLLKPVLVQDSAFHIDALSGFPGPYIKYAIETIGTEGILKLMEDVEDRSAHFEHALVYVDQKGYSHSFTSSGEEGTIAKTAYNESYEHSWSDLWRIYIPKSATKTLAELFIKEQYRPSYKSETVQFIEWLEQVS